MANGVAFDMRAMTAAHRSIAFGTVVRVTNLENGRTIKVQIEDRGPFVDGRIIDLSANAGRMLGITRQGVAQVRVEVFASDQLRT
jgi:rare lipoprotein A